jgi:hypothetical protein
MVQPKDLKINKLNVINKGWISKLPHLFKPTRHCEVLSNLLLYLRVAIIQSSDCFVVPPRMTNSRDNLKCALNIDLLKSKLARENNYIIILIVFK